MKTYSSPYPNYAHLMHVVASKHLYFLADGRLKHQDKAIDNDLAKADRGQRQFNWRCAEKTDAQGLQPVLSP